MSYTRGKQDGRLLKLSHDRKVSPRGWYQPSRRRWIAMIPNSFGLPAGDACPGKTPFCVDCYAVGSEQSAGVRQLVEHNFRLLTEAATVIGMGLLLAEMVDRYVVEADRVALPPEDRLFRIHWDGDFFSVAYAEAWANVMRANPDVRFWAYTRSFVESVDVVPVLAGVPNLALYLSVDEHNAAAAAAQLERWPTLRAAQCAVDYRTARALIPAERSPIVCPENVGRMALMNDGRGACVECRLCPAARRDVLFSTSHREDVAVPVVRPSVPVVISARPAATVECALPGCSTTFERVPGRGRPRLYCSTEHRWDASRQSSSHRGGYAVHMRSATNARFSLCGRHHVELTDDAGEMNCGLCARSLERSMAS